MGLLWREEGIRARGWGGGRKAPASPLTLPLHGSPAVPVSAWGKGGTAVVCAPLLAREAAAASRFRVLCLCLLSACLLLPFFCSLGLGGGGAVLEPPCAACASHRSAECHEWYRPFQACATGRVC
jgi:hypothetical protein